MPRYIDAEALAEEMGAGCIPIVEKGISGVTGDETCIMDYINNAPTADVEPVRHGRWEWHEKQDGNPFDGYEIDWGWCCSNCKTELSDDYDDPDKRPTIRYCHICGAKMDGESEVEDDA